MFSINLTIEGDKVVIEGLKKYKEGIGRRAIPRGLRKIASGTAREAIRNLSGPRRGLKTKKAKGGRQRAVPQKPELAGGYPVPRVAGHLRRMLHWLGPGSTKTYGERTYSTNPYEALVLNAAVYAGDIHEGTGSSERYGERPFIDDAFETFNAGARSVEIVEQEIAKEKKRSGLE